RPALPYGCLPGPVIGPGQPYVPGQPVLPNVPSAPLAQPGPEAVPPGTDSFAQAPEAGTAGGGSFTPNMLGAPNAGPCILRRVSFPTTAFVGPGGRPQQLLATRSVLVPQSGRGPYKIAENESPRPQDRVFLSYNYFNDTSTAFSGLPHSDLHRETFGFEKTF